MTYCRVEKINYFRLITHVVYVIILFLVWFKQYFILNQIQLTLVISTSVISSNRLSRRDNLIPVLT